MRITDHLSRVGIAAVVVLLVVGLTIPMGVNALDQEKNEPNDAQGAATAITGTSTEGEISMKGGTDWFSKEFSASETVSFALTKSLSELGLKISLHAPDGTKLDNATARDGVGKAEVSATATQSGTYAVKIEPVASDVMGIPYTVYAPASKAPPEKHPPKLESGVQQESEPNNEWINAEPIKHKTVAGVPEDKDDPDWYSFLAKKDQEVSVLVIKTDGSDSTLYVEFRSPDHQHPLTNELADKLRDKTFSIDYGDVRGQAVIDAEQAGRYYMEIESNSAEEEPYEIKIKRENTSKSEPSDSGTDTTEPTDTEQPSDPMTQTESEGDQQQETERDMTSLFGPGFTGGGAIVALFVTMMGLFALRRQ